MNTAVVNVKINPAVKKEAQKVAGEMGLSLSAVINGFLRHFVKTREISFSAAEEPSNYLIESLKEAEQDIKKGRVSPTFNNARDAIAWLNNPKRKYVNQLRQKVYQTTR